MEIITNLELLQNPAEPLVFIEETTYNTTEGLEIIQKLKDTFEENPNIKALSAPQIGINKRIFGIRYDDGLRFFINPIVKEKRELVIYPETFASMPNNEILIGRPRELTAVYYTENFKLEDNKLLWPASQLFDQMNNVLDGITPDQLGMVFETSEEDSLANLFKAYNENIALGETKETMEKIINQFIESYKQFVDAKLSGLQKDISEDDEMQKTYNQLKFTEDVINGRTKVVIDSQPKNRAQRRAANKAVKKQMKEDQALKEVLKTIQDKTKEVN